MKAGLVGLPGAGKSTLFRAITRSEGGGDPFRLVDVPDPRVERLAEIYSPKKVTHAHFHCEDFAGIGADDRGAARLFGSMRDMDTLALVVRCFEDPSYPHERPEVAVGRDIEALRSAFQVADFVMVENRIEKLGKSVTRPSKTVEQDKKQLALLLRCRETLEAGGSIGDVALGAGEDLLIRGFRFLTRKPMMLVLNLPDDGDAAQFRSEVPAEFEEVFGVRGALEGEIAQLEGEDAQTFMEEFGITETVRDTLVHALYRLLGLSSFLTVGEDEVRAWTIRTGESAVKAAGEVHSDIQRGFIRAEVVTYDDIIASGSFKDAKAASLMRLEGKEYVVKDGDVINFRFSV